MKYDAIISLTSYKERLKYVSRTIFSLLKGTIKNIKIVLTVYADDVKYIQDDLCTLIANDLCELLVVNEDLGPHKKYFYTMQKYKSDIIITVDDDVMYEKDFVESLLAAHKKYPNAICARRTHLICCDDNLNALDNSHWKIEYKKIEKPSMMLYASGVGGVLYPPEIYNQFNIKDNLFLIKELLFQDDMFLKVMEIQNNVPVLYVKNEKNHPTPIDEKEVKDLALCKINDGKRRNAVYFSKIKNYFDSLFR